MGKGRLSLKEEAIMKIKFGEVKKVQVEGIFGSIEEEKMNIEDLDVRFSDLNSKMSGLVEENKSLLASCQELTALVDNYPNVKDQKQRLSIIEEKMNTTKRNTSSRRSTNRKVYYRTRKTIIC